MIMCVAVGAPENWGRLHGALSDIQEETGVYPEFGPLPFVHMQEPRFRKGRARRGPTWEEVVKMHAVSRLAFRGLIDNIQVSWVKCGLDGCKLILNSGANDLGGTLMNESISRPASASHGEEGPPEAMRETIRSIGRVAAQRSTTYDILEVFDAVA